MNKKFKLAMVISLFILVSCSQSTKKDSSLEFAEAIYYGGDILSMEGDTANYADAVAVKNGKILFVGSKAEIEKFHGDSKIINDLHKA